MTFKITSLFKIPDYFIMILGYLYINMDIEYKLVGRNDLLQQYCEAWSNNCRIFGYYGMAKVGKTRLCDEFIKHLQETEDSKVEVTEFDFRDGDLDSYENFEALLFLKFQIDSNHRSSVGREQILQYVKKMPETKFIFVFDSLEEAMPKAQKDGSGPDKFAESLWDKIYQNIVHKFLANSSNIYFCLTSCTWAKFGQWSKIAFLQNVPALNKSDSSKLLKEVLSDKNEDTSCLETIAELCDGLPGSIVNVGSDIIRSTELTNEDMVSILIDRKLAALSGEFLPATVRIDSSLNGMIRKLSTERKDNLRVLAASGSDMSMSVGAQAFDYDKQALFKFDVLIPLKYRSLVDASMKSKGISVHPVTQEFMKVHHASTTIRDKAIAKKIQKLIEEICEQKDKAPGKSMEYIDQLKDYKSQGCPDNYVPVSGDRRGSVEHSRRDTSSDNIRIRTNISHTSTGNPRLNDLSPATSTEKEDKQGFSFPADTNLHKSMEQKPSFRKDIKYAGNGVSGEMKCESGYQANINGDQKEIKQKRLSEVKMNLGCSIEENDRIAVTSERRLSDIIKRNNLSRSASAQEMFSETKANNLSRAMTLQESLTQLQFKRKTLNRADAFEDTGDVKWDDCSGSSQNILAESISQSSICSTDSRNSSCERNDTVSLDDNVNVPCNESGTEVKFQIYSESFSPEDLKQDLRSNDPPIVRPKTSLTKSPIKEENDNSLKRLLFGQIDLTSGSETSLKRPVEHSCSFGPTLDPNSLLDESVSNNLESHCVCQGNSLSSSQQSSYKDPIMPKLSLLSLLSKSSQKSAEVSMDRPEHLQTVTVPVNSASPQSANIGPRSNASKVPNRAETLLKLIRKKSEDKS
ncbi:unnamed protein product [Mytilus coruscus]|uniref:Uncharacterized protein n=1 Tax=Mytilus coruscus TaxID=42192 RepID=A0A6J8BL33_MYTCO|nr:unnamed protein product [Mytilus coruscus]